MTDQDLQAFANTYQFRRRGPFEGRETYRQALAEHVSSRDMAAGHAIRIDVPKEQWTETEYESFRAQWERERRTGQAFQEPPAPGQGTPVALDLMALRGHFAPTDDGLQEMATVVLTRACEYARSKKITDPEHEALFLPTLAVLFTNGIARMATLPDRANRIVILKQVIRNHRDTAYGYVMLLDAFMHRFNLPDAQQDNDLKARDQNPRVLGVGRQSVLIVHIGSRTLRRSVRRAYQYRPTGGGSRVVFDDKDPEVIDWRELPPDEHVDDPYVDVFATNLAPTRPQ